MKNWFKIDKEDLDIIKSYKWFNNGKYAIAHHYINGKRTTLYMHRLLMGNPKGILIKIEIDHINGDGLDNKRKNLRIVTRQQNHFNTHKIVSKSGFKGVTKKGKYYYAHIQKGNKRIHLGIFKDKNYAAKAYNYAAKKYFGEYAYLNQL